MDGYVEKHGPDCYANAGTVSFMVILLEGSSWTVMSKSMALAVTPTDVGVVSFMIILLEGSSWMVMSKTMALAVTPTSGRFCLW